MDVTIRTIALFHITSALPDGTQMLLTFSRPGRDDHNAVSLPAVINRPLIFFPLGKLRTFHL
jgi:hypothetical protein